jgi:hypothetical protein
LVLLTGLVIFQALSKVESHFRVSFPANSVLQKLVNLHVDEFILLANFNGLLLSVASRGTHKDDTLGATCGFGDFKLKYPSNLFQNLGLVLHTVKLSDEALANLAYSSHVNVVFTNGCLRKAVHLLGVFALDNSVLACERGTDLVLREAIVLCKKNELVGDYAHFHEGDSLNFSAREALNDVGLFLFLHKLNLLFDQLDNDFILDEAAGLARLLNFFTEGRALRDFFVNQVASRNAFEVVVFAEVLN